MTRRKPQPRPVAPQRVPGYRPKRRTREITPDAEAWPALAPEEGCAPLTATVQTNLTFEQLDAIPLTIKVNADGDGVLITCDDRVREAIAPYVVDWNAEAIDLTTGDPVPVPPPAEIGVKAFQAVDWQIGAWLAAQLKTVHRLPAPELTEKKEPTGSTPATASE